MEPLLKVFLAFFLAVAVTIASGSLHLTQAATPDLINQASQRYGSGQYQAAKTLWQQAAKAAANDVQRAVSLGNLALTLQQLGEWEAAEAAIDQGLQLRPPSPTDAQLLDIQGQLNYGRGRFQGALEQWRQAEEIYAKGTDLEGLAMNRLNQAQAMQMLGLFAQAEKHLNGLRRSLDQQANPLLKVRGMRSWMEISAKLGRFENLDAAQTMAQGLESAIAQLPTAQQPQEKAAMLLTMANINRAFAERERESNATADQSSRRCKSYATDDNATGARKLAQQALAKYQAIAKVSGTSGLQSDLSQLSLSQELGRDNPDLIQSIEAQLSQLPPSRPSIFAEINLAQSLLCAANIPDETIAQHLTLAINQAQRLQDKRAESYATGVFGHLYEQQAQKISDPAIAKQQWTYAKKLSEKALLLADSLDAADISYQWQWQMGRILKGLGGEANRQTAIEVFYPRAIKSLETVRGELVGTNPDVQFSFRDDAEPVYREFVDLLLSEASPSPETLGKAIALIDSLQVAELENFFRCVLSQLVEISQVTKKEDPEAAIFYPIILPDRLEVILQLPNQAAPIRYRQMIPNAELEIDQATTLLKEALLNSASLPVEYKQPGAQIYQWLLKGAEPYLQEAKVKTLVFVLDGGLRNIPISALWDGKGFVMQKYAVAVTPGLKLLGPQRFGQKTFRALIGGLTGDEPTVIASSRQEFGALPFVKEEVNRLQEIMSQSTVLRGEEFVQKNLVQTLKERSFPILHLATHGKFSSNPKDTYLVMADDLLSIDNLQDLLRVGKGNRREALELLVLSACETAIGNRRATLGMAGVAIRSGASSTVATLWTVDDRSTGKLVEAFYRNLLGGIEKQDGTTKVQALRSAQLALLENKLDWNGKPQPKDVNFSHPYYWAPFILLGNWL
jgi:CHAT domain-containing protein